MALLVELSPQNPAKNLSSYFHTPQENTLAWIFAKPIPHNTLRYSTLYAVSRGESRVLLRRAKFVSPSLQGIHPRIPALGEKKKPKKKKPNPAEVRSPAWANPELGLFAQAEAAIVRDAATARNPSLPPAKRHQSFMQNQPFHAHGRLKIRTSYSRDFTLSYRSKSGTVWTAVWIGTDTNVEKRCSLTFSPCPRELRRR